MRHRSPSHLFFFPSLSSGQATVSRARPSCSVFIPSLLFTLSLVGCQAAINQAFIPGIKVTFRGRFHALILWKAEWRRGSDRGALTRTRSWWAAVVQAVVTMLLLMISSRCYVSVIQMKVGYELCADKNWSVIVTL